MDIAVSTLRAELSSIIDRVRAGEEIVVTERGTPVVRLVAVDSAPIIERLTAAGVLSVPNRSARPVARGAHRVPTQDPVSDLVAEQRR